MKTNSHSLYEALEDLVNRAIVGDKTPSQRAVLVDEAKEQIIKLVLDEVIGPDFVNWGEVTTDEQRLEAHGNEVRRRMRRKIKGE